ncbi:peptidoglycan-binding protein LysM [Bernardetia sp. ABR2-2B]|uniref:peptidoglycan-binding protein LysM n=1 Tax=Bernardetia sp. ABR2-2B TaxID=3127472 RepID=UPI0030CBFCD8
MGLFSFIKEAGAKVFGKKEEKRQAPDPQIAKHIEEEQKVEKSKLESLRDQVVALNIPIDNLNLAFGQSVTVTGKTQTNAEREKIILAIGNVEGVSIVEDKIEVVEKEKEAEFYTVKKGDSLSKIAGEFYDNVQAYPIIFEANKPMLKDPSLIYPGQVLRIPAQ